MEDGHGCVGEKAFARSANAHTERKANAPSWLDCSGGQPTFVTPWGGSDVDREKGRLLRLSNISYSFNRPVLP